MGISDEEERLASANLEVPPNPKVKVLKVNTEHCDCLSAQPVPQPFKIHGSIALPGRKHQ